MRSYASCLLSLELAKHAKGNRGADGTVTNEGKAIGV